MKFFLSIGLLSFLPLLAVAQSSASAAVPASITLVQFANPSQGGAIPTELAATGGYAIPIGNNGKETTYQLNIQKPQTIVTSARGSATTVTTTSTATQTVVVSASGWRSDQTQGNNRFKMDCHYTASEAGECVVEGVDIKQTGTITGTPVAVVVAVSAPAKPVGNVAVGPGGGSGSDTKNGATRSSAPAFALLGGLIAGVFAVLY